MISFLARDTTSLGSIPNLTDNLAYLKTYLFLFLTTLLINILINQAQLIFFRYFMKHLFKFNQQTFAANIGNIVGNYLLNWFEVGKLIIGKGEIVR